MKRAAKTQPSTTLPSITLPSTARPFTMKTRSTAPPSIPMEDNAVDGSEHMEEDDGDDDDDGDGDDDDHDDIHRNRLLKIIDIGLSLCSNQENATRDLLDEVSWDVVMTHDKDTITNLAGFYGYACQVLNSRLRQVEETEAMANNVDQNTVSTSSTKKINETSSAPLDVLARAAVKVSPVKVKNRK